MKSSRVLLTASVVPFSRISVYLHPIDDRRRGGCSSVGVPFPSFFLEASGPYWEKEITELSRLLKERSATFKDEEGLFPCICKVKTII